MVYSKRSMALTSAVFVLVVTATNSLAQSSPNGQDPVKRTSTDSVGPVDSANQRAPTSVVLPGTGPADYRLHLNDKLELQFPFSPEYNETVAIQPDGRISLREADPVQVAGMTLQDAEALIQHAYAGILKDPRVFLGLKDFQAPSFYASGEIGHPGRYELRSETTLLQAISEAGGMLNERARKKEIVIFRPQGNGTYQSRVINLKPLLEAKGSLEDYPILPGDIVYVPQNRASKIQKFLPNANMGAYLSPTSF